MFNSSIKYRSTPGSTLPQRVPIGKPSKAVRPIDLFVQISCLLRELWPKDFQPRWEEVARVTGSQDFEHLYIENKPAADILAVFHKSAEEFAKTRQPYLLY